MKTLKEVLNYKFECIDGRDINRLCQFLTIDEIKLFGEPTDILKDEERKPVEWNRKNVLRQLKADVEFGFEKALDKRGISASMMFSVVKFWNWVLEEGLEDWNENNYAEYGLPLFKATALKYGWDNPIGDDAGNENEYSMEYEDMNDFRIRCF